MKSYSSTGITAFICATILSAPFVCMAKNTPVAIGSLRAKSFDAEPVVMLPGNPFYGIIGTFDIVKESVSGDKLATRTALLNRYAARLLRTYEVNAKDEKNLLRSLKDYQGAAYQYAMVVTRLEKDLRVPEVINQVSLTLSTHLRLIDEAIEWKQFTNAHKALLSDVNERLSTATVTVLENVIPADVFADLVITASSDKALVEKIRTAEVINIIAKAAARLNSNEVAKTLLEKRSGLLTAMVAPAQEQTLSLAASTMMAAPAEARSMKVELMSVPASFDVAELKQFAGSSAERLQTVLFLLDTPSLRGNQDLIDLKNLLLIRAF